MNRLITMTIGLLLVALLTGCNTAPKRDPEFAAVRPSVPAPPPVGNGAIYQADHGITWFEDMRAKRVGDILTIKLAEQMDASKKASTEIEKSNSNSVTNPTLFGQTPSFNLPGLVTLSGGQNNLDFSLSSAHDFSGEGDSSQSNKLTGDITVTVVEILANGNMFVRGEKRLGINQGNEYIKVSGIVRPNDIDSTNTVISTKLADPTILYIGDGPVAEANVMGWLARFFISNIFPF